MGKKNMCILVILFWLIVGGMLWHMAHILADSGIPTSSQSPLRPGFLSYVTCVTRVVICVNC